ALIVLASDDADSSTDFAARFAEAITNPWRMILFENRYRKIADNATLQRSGGSHEAVSRPCRGRQSRPGHRLLLGAVRRPARGGETGLREVDARGPAGQFRDFGARPSGGRRPPRHPGRGPG